MINIEKLKTMTSKQGLTIPKEVEHFLTSDRQMFSGRSKRSVLKSYDYAGKEAMDNRKAGGATDEELTKLKGDIASIKRLVSMLLDQWDGVSRKPKQTKVGLHLMNQYFSSTKTLTLFDEQEVTDYAENVGMKINRMPGAYGMVLTQHEQRVFEAICKALSDTNYQGHDQRTPKEEFNKMRLKTDLRATQTINKTYGDITVIPVIRVGQEELAKLAGYDVQKWNMMNFKSALDGLRGKQFFFFWERLKKGDNGKPVMGKDGKYIKEEVNSLDTIFRIDEVKEDRKFQYYEISPSAVVIDQIKNYFLLIPADWREEAIRMLSKPPSKDTISFLLWLRVQFEQIRRRKVGKKSFVIKKRWEDIAQTLKIPESIYRRNKHKGRKIREDAYAAAIKLGYLDKIEEDDFHDVLYLNKKFYPTPGELM